MKLLFLLFLCYLSVFVAVAQLPKQANFHVLRYNVDNGLPTNNVIAITQDQQGFIWLATDDGLVRFDGKSFITFKHNEPTNQLPESNLVGIFADSQNCLWIATQSKGIVCYNLKTKEWQKYPELKFRGGVMHQTKFFEDQYHQIWIDVNYQERERVVCIPLKTKKVQLFLMDSMLYVNDKFEKIIYRQVPHAGRIWADKEGNIYKGIYPYNPKKQSFDRHLLPTKANLDTLRTFFSSNKNRLINMADSANIDFNSRGVTLDKYGNVWWGFYEIYSFNPPKTNS